ncbi:Crp/Fnr family transcriptional regulator [Streptomyces sp. WAC05374]|uniref:Crp/Fnr family transcriptional regulator n=1 Tax=unclassified Streptomyces TaxID=2593676 RepID=UPI000F8660EE|nr:Crp/Fnr family transcriptional regulator [Streptomyces sp. WAC05374]RST18225.1 Crp/Fnr family transcriptional regulator [Streptomyces sp. WAC05374]TDF40446.1 Crp/Fnr family transcriptional regulator [Streptomyces sp. WAC05374]TDF49080.1 Crp/Fnr family transcriptional regulator [Streptomyces sp. WAC05374]TDF49566.1 Crp/Fnr family transcriptional regulator [Streptomyces sp. WAC05374]
MGFWKPDEPIQIGSAFYTIDPVTGRLDREAFSRPSHVIDRNPFLRRLPKDIRSSFHESMASSRSYGRRHVLRGVGTSSTIHIVLQGCVAERTPFGSSSTVRLLGAGAVLGDTEIFDERAPASTATCLNTTWTLGIPLDRMRALADGHTGLLKAIGRSVTDRMEATERIYNRHALKPEQRLCGLLAHLLMHCAVPGREYDFMVEGPSQNDLADALSLSLGSVEAGIASLRRSNIVVTGYRSYEFPSVRRLLKASEINFPPGTLANSLSAAD